MGAGGGIRPAGFPVWLAAVAVVGLAVTGWQAWAYLGHEALAGCGAGSSCEAARSSRFGYVLGWPIALWAAGLYAGLLASTVWHDRGAARYAWRAAAWLLFGAAVVYTSIQLLSLGGLCVWCMASHAVGLVWSVSALRVTGGLGGGETAAPRRVAVPAWALAVVGLAATLGVQAVSSPPASYATRSLHSGDGGGGRGAGEVAGLVRDAGGAVVDREMRLLIDPDKPGLSLRLAGWPRIGPIDAPDVALLLFDFTCGHCLDVHDALLAIQREHPDQFAVVLLPAPKDLPPPGASPGAAPGASPGTAPSDGERLARDAVALWRVRPEAFARWDRAVAALPFPPRVEAARALLGEVAGEAMERVVAEADADATASALRRVEGFQRVSGNTLVPTVLLPTGSWTGGLVDDTARSAFDAFIEAHTALQLDAVGPTPASTTADAHDGGDDDDNAEADTDADADAALRERAAALRQRLRASEVEPE